MYPTVMRMATKTTISNVLRCTVSTLDHPMMVVPQQRNSATMPTFLPPYFAFLANYPRRSFHSSGMQSFPIRRRRRGDNRIGEAATQEDTTSGPRSNPLQHTPVRDVLLFRQAASDLFDKLERALLPMKAKNDPFILSRSHGEIGEIFKLDLGPKEGFYQLEISEQECVFEYSSPISGKILYCLSSTTGEWVGLVDGNAFEGILVRDLIRQCQGLPDL
ncbi:hypothetical protein IV203_000616 [Nitzschia inconspicua]|uniref:Uncharacterized protein n=1 Tax=Nitzschia inconspicua TaxID=303405 RepID=A0A9K3PQ45_9STRA|nr:hypothetical protein IV203_000616 [Nitzschia inconspicua]